MILYQTYIGESGSIYSYSPAPCSNESMRLRLDSVVEQSGAITNPGYVFTYDDRYKLPDRNSREQDAWGFFSSSAAGTMIPSLVTTNGLGQFITLNGAEVRPDTAKAKASSLKKIKYPTGGSTQFKYEGNQAGDNKISIPYVATQVVVGDPDFAANFYKTFNVNRGITNEAIAFSFYLSHLCSGIPVGATLKFSVTSADGLTTYVSQQFSALNDVGKTFVISVNNFANGNYKLAYSTTAGICTENLGFSLSWTEIKYDNTQWVGGLRIKKMIDFDGVDHAGDIVRNYKYTYPNGVSSGTVGTRMSYNYQIQAPCGAFQCLFFCRTATTKAPLAYVQGAPIAYRYVETSTQNGAGNNGKEANYFYSFNEWSDAPTGGGGPPFAPPQYMDWAIGQLIKKEIYDNTDRLINRITNQFEYSEINQSNFWNIRVFHFITEEVISDRDFAIKNYNWVSGHLWKTSTRNVTYSSPTDSIVSSSVYSYDPTYYSLKESKTVRSLADTLETRLYYPYDYDTTQQALKAFSKMVYYNIIDKPVSSETWLKNGAQKRMVSGYALDFLQQGSLIKPSKYYTLTTTKPIDQSTAQTFNSSYLTRPSLNYRQEVEFEYYDSKGNPLQLMHKGVRKSYIWDYKNTSVIAEVTNAASSDVAYTSFEAEGNGNWTIPSSSRTSISAYTGFQSYNLTSGNISKSDLNTSCRYVVSFWANSPGASVNGLTPDAGISANGWTYYETSIAGVSSVSIESYNNSILIDELRLLPKEAVMTTYSYEPGKGVKAISNSSNLPNFFEYDELGRLKTIRDPMNKVLKTYQYHYKNQKGAF